MAGRVTLDAPVLSDLQRERARREPAGDRSRDSRVAWVRHRPLAQVG